MDLHKAERQNLLIGSVYAAITCIIWSGNFVIAKASAGKIPPISLAFYRLLLATICMLPLVKQQFIEQFHLAKKHFKHLFWVSFTGFSFYSSILYFAGYHTSAINLSLIGATSAPIFSVIIAVYLFKEGITINRIIGMLICTVGLLYLISKGDLSNLQSVRFSWGDVLILIGSAVFAFYNNLAKFKPAALKSMHYLFFAFSVGTITLLPFWLIEISLSSQKIVWNTQAWGMIAYLGIGCSVIAYLLWNKSIALIGTSSTALFGNLIPVLSVIEAIILLNEPFTQMHIWGSMIVFTGLFIANFSHHIRLKPKP